MYSYEKKMEFKNPSAVLLALMSLCLGACLVWFSGTGLWALIMQILGFALITVSVSVASTYLLRRMTFFITLREGEDETNPTSYDFIIRERRSRLDFKHCHVSLADICYVRLVDRENRKQVEKERREMRRFTFDTRFAPKKRIEVVCQFDEEQKISMLVSYDEALFAILSSAVEVKK